MNGVTRVDTHSVDTPVDNGRGHVDATSVSPDVHRRDRSVHGVALLSSTPPRLLDASVCRASTRLSPASTAAKTTDENQIFMTVNDHNVLLVESGDDRGRRRDTHHRDGGTP
jgi:hypothetical protein